MRYFFLRPRVAPVLLCRGTKAKSGSARKLKWASLAFLAVSTVPSPSLAEESPWNVWFASQIQQHPNVIAAREQRLGSNANADAIEQPLFNPELSADLERNGQDDNYWVGVEQTIDWWDRRGARRQQAIYLRAAAESRYRQELLDITATSLSALVEWHSALRAANIATAQKDRLDTLFDLVQRRQQAGDLGAIDAELTFLSLSERLAQVAEAEAHLQKAESRVRELLPHWAPEQGGVPDDFWPSAGAPPTDEGLLAHPAVSTAKALWQSLDEGAEATRRAAKPEPTIGFNAGRDGNEDVLGLSFSIPWNVRNNFSAESRAAESAALEAEARFRAAVRKQRFKWQAALAAWERFEMHYRQWNEVVQGRVENSADLLHRQWASGDLSTTDYLQALSQRAESLLAGIELENQARLALTEVLLQSGHLTSTASVPLETL